MLSEEVKSWGLSSSQAKRGPGSRKPRPGGLTEAFSQDFHFTLENRGIVGGLGVSGNGKEDSYSTFNKKRDSQSWRPARGLMPPAHMRSLISV